MDKSSMNKGYPTNPLGVIALFVFLIEIISTISLKLVLDKKPDYAGDLINFIIFFPATIVFVFFIILYFKREVLYSPNDFANEENFMGALEKKVKTLEVRQEASIKDIRDIKPEDAYAVVESLIGEEQHEHALVFTQSFMKIKRYDVAQYVFLKLEKMTELRKHEREKVLRNLVYIYVNDNKYAEALSLVKSKLSNKVDCSNYWLVLAVSYAYYKTRNQPKLNESLGLLKKCPTYDENINQSIKIYPEIKEILKNEE